MQCVIISRTSKKVLKNTRSALLPIKTGAMQVLQGHAESFILLSKGEICIEATSHRTKLISITRGFCHVTADTITIVL